ncbi:MAG: aminotransferase class III-fold pyridoxal phosphate-dependent enzyme [Myxococcales bacterium]|nr:aminotransferase class III-fold pyridoxal phosphate-dependent enzyme [Myxococcales bacterium]MCB9630091.1 aminotransferase class III-fold pyridoxal phosphate-dependent enzyme [Sandaracinaceae bacterium]
MEHALPPSPVHVLETAVRPAAVMVRGAGDELFDQDGKRYLDFVQGWAVNSLGHSPEAVARALRTQASALVHSSAGYFNAPQVQLCTTLARLSGLERTFLCATGAEANESAIKLARKWGQRERGGAWEIVTTADAFHGRTLATMSASGKSAFAPLFEPKVQGFRKVPFGDAAAVEAALDERVAAVLVEPIQGEAGVVVPPRGYLRQLRELCSAQGVLLMFDEVQTGVGRTGALFAFEHEGARPDVMTLGKGLGAGVPLAAMLCDARVACFEPGDQGGTYSGNALTSAVGQAVLEAVTAPGFLDHVNAMSVKLRGVLEALVPRGLVASVRGAGLLLAAELPAATASDVVRRAHAEGLLLNAPRPNLLRFMPALNVLPASIDELAERLPGLLEAAGRS